MTIYPENIASKYIKLLLIILSLILLFIIAIPIDFLLGYFISSDGIIFRPNSITSFETSEFKYTAKINKLGFRDRDFDVSKKSKKRIIIIGDSFTFGWGVNIEQSWPKILENNLTTSGFDLEICNLGEPGGSPVDYANIAEKAIPILKPDVVVIAVLQGEDIMQLAESEDLNKKTLKQKIKITIKYLYPNTLRLVKNIKDDIIINPDQIRQVWKTNAITIVKSFNKEQLDRFNLLSDYVRYLFYNGDLNPHLISIAIKTPTYYVDTLYTNNDNIKSSINIITKCFNKIKYIANQYHSNVIIVSVPYGIYVSNYDYVKRGELGYLLNSDMLTSNSADEAIELASKNAGIDFLTVTDKIRERCKHSRLYIDLDGHFNANGNRDYADILTPLFITYLEKSFPKGDKR